MPLEAKNAIVVCAICRREITTIQISCAVCKHVDLCVECFARGSESADLPEHKRSHAYRVIDNLSVMTLFSDVPLALTPAAAAAASGGEWSAKEELMLLDGIDMYGYGNWRDIASFVGSRTDAQCLRHYTWVYLDPAGPMAVSQRGGSLAAPGGSDTGSGSGTTQGPASSPSGASTGAAGAASGAGTAGGAAAVAAPAPPSSTLLGGAGTPGFPHGHIPRPDPPFAISGYMPLRGDFDIEWDNEAEAALADMDFVEGEHATETELKLRVLEIYCAKLDERERRKRFVLERGLLEHKRLQAVERRRPKEERELYDSLRPFARFASPAEHEDLVRGLILENRLRKRIAQLAEYRRVGLRSLAEAQDYETAKRKGGLVGFFRQRELAAAAAAATAAASIAAGSAGSVEIGAAGAGLSAFPHSLQPAGAGVEGLGADPAAVRAAMAQIIGVPIASAPPVAAATGGSEAAASVSVSTAGAVPPAAANGSSASGDSSATTGRKRQRPAASSPEASPQVSPPAAAAAPPVVPGFSLAGMPGVDRLTRAEVALCETLALLPYQYLQIKTTILNVAAMKGLVRPRDVSTALLHVDVIKVKGVYNFCVRAGAIPPPPPPSARSSSVANAAAASAEAAEEDDDVEAEAAAGSAQEATGHNTAMAVDGGTG